MNPDRIVVGAFDPEDAERVVELHRGLHTEFVRTDVPSAELVKLAANAFLSTRISFINEIANVCELVGADVVDVARGVGLDHRLGPHFLRAGIGFGGSCFPKDVTALKQLAGNSGYHVPAPAGGVGGERAAEAARRAEAAAARSAASAATVALLGLAFKPDTDDMREAPSRVIAYRLIAEGAEVRAWDPVARPRRPRRGVEICETRARGGAGRRRGGDRDRVAAAARASRAPRCATRWRTPLIVDGRNLLDPEAARRPASSTRRSAAPTAPPFDGAAGGGRPEPASRGP